MMGIVFVSSMMYQAIKFEEGKILFFNQTYQSSTGQSRYSGQAIPTFQLSNLPTIPQSSNLAIRHGGQVISIFQSSNLPIRHGGQVLLILSLPCQSFHQILRDSSEGVTPIME
ncbi:hypothetical protein SAMN05421761_105118 [Belliella pelovolcani]|uniref:Uncharacterized protein n=1 Tax=Belliella pelovolcani TaxID=529505 RepID=A0A1N7M5Z0_9BACT|nr:hypothetical protein SAMN05421761_105118 [Belliella pelovolcani]